MVSRIDHAAFRASLLGLLAVLAAVLGGCQPLEERILTGTRWQLESITTGQVAGLGGEVVADEGSLPAESRERPSIAFEAAGDWITSDRLHGFGGEHTFVGTFQTSADGRLTIAQLTAVAVAGDGPAGALETQFLHELGRARTYRVDGDELTIFGDGSTLRLRRYGVPDPLTVAPDDEIDA